MRGNLAYLHNREKVVKNGTGKDVRWTLLKKMPPWVEAPRGLLGSLLEAGDAVQYC